MIVETYSAPNVLVDLTVPLVRVRPSGFNPRKRFDEAALQELAESIREHGLLEPIVVRPCNPPKNQTAQHYEIVAGERRYRACIMAGLTEIPVRVAEGLSDAAALKLAIIENVQRQDLDPVEEAEGYRALASLGMKQREIAESVHRSQPAVANAMRLLDLPEDVLERIRKGELTASHGVALASYKANPHVQEVLAELAVKENWTTKRLESYFSGTQGYDLPRELSGYVYELRGGCGWNWQLDCRGNCPHDAVRAANWEHLAWCLRPACFEEKRRTVEKAQETAAAARVQEAQATGAALPKTSDFGKWDGDGYQTIGTWTELPEGCEPACPKRIEALGAGGVEVEICSDAKCWKRLEMATTRSKNKAGRNRAKEMIVDLEKRIDGLQEVGPREVAILAALAMSDFKHAGMMLNDVFQRHSLDDQVAAALAGERWDNSTHDRVAWNRYQVLSECSLLQLTRIILEMAIRNESKNLSENPQWKEATPIADWYLDATEPTAEPAEPTICQKAGLPCEPSTCVQECPKAAVAQDKPAEGEA